jgi:poly(3-hydroxybutyrate) depolymerase
MRRRVRLYLPKNYEADKPAPVILAFHNKHRNGTHFEHVTDFSNSEINKDAIVLYPDGIDVSLRGS